MMGKALVILCLVLATAGFAAMPSPALAQSPFAVPGSDAAPAAPDPGLFTSALRTIMAMQQEYYRAMAGALRAVNLQHSLAAAWALVSVSFLYGIFHAAGPGHGKIVVASYLLADERDVKRGVLIAFLAAFVQAITAILVVGILAIILGFTYRTTADAVPIIERASFALIAGLGAWLLWRAVREGGGHHHHPHTHEHGHDHEDHAHMPTPAEIRQAKGIKGMAAMILSVGLRPCSGAILVLLFAVTQGAFLIGVASALVMSVGTAITVSTLAVLTVFSKSLALRFAGGVDSPWAARIEKALKIGGGAVLVIFGLLLLAGSFTQPPQPLL